MFFKQAGEKIYKAIHLGSILSQDALCWTPYWLSWPHSCVSHTQVVQIIHFCNHHMPEVLQIIQFCYHHMPEVVQIIQICYQHMAEVVQIIYFGEADACPVLQIIHFGHRHLPADPPPG